MVTCTIGQRLREIRKQLGLNQEDFGKLGGVKKLAQINYEKDARTPPYKYFDNLRELDGLEIDVEYILTGTNGINNRFRLLAEARVNCLIAMALDLNPDAFCNVINEAFHEEIDQARGDTPPSEFYLAEKINPKLMSVEDNVYKIVEGSPSVINLEILKSLIIEFDTYLTSSNLILSSEKKATLLLMLYETFKARGKVDVKTIEEMVKLACT